jgi:hypothetical protein
MIGSGPAALSGLLANPMVAALGVQISTPRYISDPDTVQGLTQPKNESANCTVPNAFVPQAADGREIVL